MSQIVTSNYFIPTVFTGVAAYYGGLHIWNTLYALVTSFFNPQVVQQALADYNIIFTSWVVVLQENIGIFRNTTSPFALFTLYIVSLQLTNLQYMAYISLYILVRSVYAIFQSSQNMKESLQSTVQYYLAEPMESQNSLTYYIPKEYSVDLSPIIISLAVVFFLYFSKHLIQFEKPVEKKEKVMTKHPMTLRSSKKRATLMLTDHSLS